MSDISNFSPETIEKLKYYVYRLIDPRNGNTFYVGKGTGNRVFEHAKNAIKYRLNEDKDSLKSETIKDIIGNGLNVIHIIHRYGMDSSTAFEVESALIDAYPGLSNSINGHNSYNGVANACQIENNNKKPVFQVPDEIKFIIIKTSAYKDNGWAADKEDPIYEATRWSWIAKLSNAKKYKFVLSVDGGVVNEVFEVENWYKREDSRRIFFVGKRAKDEIRNVFIDKRIPDKYTGRGKANPILYSD